MSRILYFQNHGESINEKETTSWGTFGEACFALTPKVSVPGNRQVLLDVESTRSYFGSEARILAMLGQICATFGVRGSTVLTDRPEWARVFATGTDILIPAGKSFTKLLKLPIERLQQCGNPFTIEEELPERQSLTGFMQRVGMDTIDHFARLSPTAVGRRFGKLGMTLQQWVLGKRELTLPVLEPTQNIEECVDTEEISSLDGLALYLQEALARIEIRLKARSLLAQKITLRFSLESRNTIVDTLGLSEPLMEAQALLRLIMTHLQRMEWDSPLQRLEVAISEGVPQTPGQLSLWDPAENRQADLGNFVRTLRYRYGEENVGVAELCESYLPERSWRNVWPPPRKAAVCARDVPPNRPVFLYATPRPFQVPRNTRLTASENLDVEWWEEPAGRRYFIARIPGRERLWIFWDLKRQQWFLHGIFD